jgi:hypothetical protein
MNIFTTSSDPIECAINLDDKRVRHMPKECFEMISMALFMVTNQAIAPFIIWAQERRGKEPKLSELFNNKCTQWTASKRENIVWLYDHARALLAEHEYRFSRQHYLTDMFNGIHHHIPSSKSQPTSWPNASGFDNKDIFESYRECLCYKWFETDEIKPVLWTRREEPKWTEKYKYRLHQGDLFLWNPGDNIDEDLPF